MERNRGLSNIVIAIFEKSEFDNAIKIIFQPNNPL